MSRPRPPGVVAKVDARIARLTEHSSAATRDSLRTAALACYQAVMACAEATAAERGFSAPTAADVEVALAAARAGCELAAETVAPWKAHTPPRGTYRGEPKQRGEDPERTPVGLPIADDSPTLPRGRWPWR